MKVNYALHLSRPSLSFEDAVQLTLGKEPLPYDPPISSTDTFMKIQGRKEEIATLRDPIALLLSEDTIAGKIVAERGCYTIDEFLSWATRLPPALVKLPKELQDAAVARKSKALKHRDEVLRDIAVSFLQSHSDENDKVIAEKVRCHPLTKALFRFYEEGNPTPSFETIRKIVAGLRSPSATRRGPRRGSRRKH